MERKTIAIYDNRELFKTTGKNFTLNVGLVKMIIEYKFNTTDSLDVKKVY